MRKGELKVVQPVTCVKERPEEGTSGFMLVVADDEGSFCVTGAQWVRERWAGAAPVEPSTDLHMQHVETIMLREADRRRHGGIFDAAHPMVLERRGAA